ncbi:hypothetical protein [Pseudomarimonas arenosa]|uniref:Uncharacterized protein n=1 Tax=Pseudomarimonas arenosa TaxID=2774145 RepID=A0AAW3ZLM4_9GAMM|nr:hypothetical protein [Pseudomarimonas arenosa]MBD8525820.1 hypothetical protein [Pseudomarimonas arenosa]
MGETACLFGLIAVLAPTLAICAPHPWCDKVIEASNAGQLSQARLAEAMAPIASDVLASALANGEVQHAEVINVATPGVVEPLVRMISAGSCSSSALIGLDAFEREGPEALRWLGWQQLPTQAQEALTWAGWGSEDGLFLIDGQIALIKESTLTPEASAHNATVSLATRTREALQNPGRAM